MPETLLFYLFAGLAIAASTLVIGQRNPMYSVMLLITSFGALAGLYVLLDAPFTAVTQIIIYAGAIMVLFLFVVMLLNVDRESKSARANRYWPWITAFGLVVLAEIVLLVLRGTFPANAGIIVKTPGAGVKDLGIELYGRYLVPFEIASVILLVGLVGAVMLAKKSDKE